MFNMKNVVIFGSSGHAKVIKDILELSSEYNFIGFVGPESDSHKLNILGDDKNLAKLVKEHSIYGGIIGVADNALRFKLEKRIQKFLH